MLGPGFFIPKWAAILSIHIRLYYTFYFAWLSCSSKETHWNSHRFPIIIQVTHHQKLFWRPICSIRWEKKVAFSMWCPCTSIVLSFPLCKLVFKCINPIPVGDVHFYQILENPLLWGLDEPVQLHTHKYLGKPQKGLSGCGVDVYLCPSCIGVV